MELGVMGEQTTPTKIDLSKKSIDGCTEEIATACRGAEAVTIVGAQGHHAIGAGIESVQRWRIEGSLGDYCLLSFGGQDSEVTGDVGYAFGQGMESGQLVVRGHAGAYLASLATRGLLAVYGSAGERCGAGLLGGELMVRGDVGKECGYRMRSGTIIVGGSAGPLLGAEMRGGTIYVRGEVDSLAPGVLEYRLKEADHIRIGLMLLKSGVKATGKEFRGFQRETSP
jgi:formylmethanofuran dehydrogenase subunit C